MTHQVLNSGQEWFPKIPLEVRLSQQIIYIDQYTNPIVPQTSYFNYIDIKQFFLAPEIALSTEVICTSGTSTMDVAAEATNVTWQLSPSNLFTTTSGNGKVATIARASGANGKGKITYSFQMPSGENFTAEKEVLIGAQKPGTITYEMDAPPGRFTTFIEDVPTATSYNWYFNGVKNSTYHGTSAVFPRKSPFCNVSYRVEVEAINPCGTSGKTYIDIFEPNCSYSLLLNPNPATNECTIELVNESEAMMDSPVEWNMEVYSQYQQLKIKKDKLKDKDCKINTSDWEEGVYIVRVKIEDQIISEKLSVKH